MIKEKIRKWLGIEVLDKCLTEIDRLYNNQTKELDDLNVKVYSCDDRLASLFTSIDVLEAKSQSNKIPWMMGKIEALEEEVLRLKVKVKQSNSGVLERQITTIDDPSNIKGKTDWSHLSDTTEQPYFKIKKPPIFGDNKVIIMPDKELGIERKVKKKNKPKPRRKK